jgi:ABC-type transport system substrate-binding protein
MKHRNYLLIIVMSCAIETGAVVQNKQFDELIKKARSQKDPAARLKLYQQAQHIFHQEMPFVPLFYPLQTAAWNTKLKGYTPHPLNRLYLNHYSIQP